MKTSYSIVTVMLLALACLFTLCYVSYSGMLLVKKSNNREKMTILNTFPGEIRRLIGDPMGLRVQILGVISAALCAVSLGLLFGGMIVRPAYDQGDLPVTLSSIFVLLFSAVACVFMGLTALLPLESLRPSLISWILFCVFTAGSGIFSMVIEGKYELININRIVTYVACGAGILLLLMFLNPKLKSWANMEKTEVDGATYWIRPKLNWMCITIWAGYVVMAVLCFLFAIGVLTASPIEG